MSPQRRFLAGLLTGLTASLAPMAAGAHPHVFIDTGITLIFGSGGQLEAVRIDWAYDEFYSLMLVEENGLDPDGDGTPDQPQLDGYAGKDVTWDAGFPGDLTLHAGDREIALARPVDHAAAYVDGRLVTSHTRPLATPLAPDEPLVVRAYDPTYFVAYDVPSMPVIQGRDDCLIFRDAADRDAARAEYGKALAEIDVSGDPFEVVEVADIGILFADSFTVTCAAGS